MSDDLQDTTIETSQEAQPHGGSLKRQRLPMYTNFDGRYRKTEELRPHLAAFADFFKEKRFHPDGSKYSTLKIVDDFNATLPEGERTFWPNPSVYARWRKRWEAEIEGRLQDAQTRLANRTQNPLVRMEDGVPTEYTDIEQGAQSLAAELLNDARATLRETNEREEYFDDEVVVKRKMYSLNVFNFVMKAAHTKQAIDLKRHAEGRETANFMLDLMKMARAGKLSTEARTLVRDSLSHVTEPVSS